MKKEDLKTGMLCQLANGDVTLFVNDTFIFAKKNTHLDLEFYNNDLKRDDSKYNIVKISNSLSGYLLRHTYWTLETLNANLLWERQEVPEYVEVLSDSVPCGGCVIGGIYKVESSNELGNLYLTDHSNIGGWYFTKNELKPSTKEAYEAQFKVNEMTIEELEKLTGLTNLKIKK
jgi:hypothetical protein